MPGPQDSNNAATSTTSTPDFHADPEFHGLPLAEKHKVLMSLDADYRGLPPSEQAKALDEIHYGQAPDQGWRNNLADAIDTGRHYVERGVNAGLHSIGMPTNYEESEHFIGQEPGQKGALRELIDAHRQAGQKSSVGYVPVLGPISVSASEHAKKREYLDMATDIGAGVAALAPFRGAGMKVADTVGAAAREPSGALRPTLKEDIAAAGGYAGHKVVPYYGAYAGYKAAPRLADAIIPDRAPRTSYGKSGAAGAYTEGESTALPKQPQGDGSAGGSGVTVLPAGSASGRGPLTPEQVPGRPKLRDIAQSGDPRAGAELQRRGERVLYNTDTGYSGVREKVGLRDAVSDSGKTAKARPVPRRAPDGKTSAGTAGAKAGSTGSKPSAYRESEKAATMSGERKSLGKDFEEGERQHQIDRYKGILKNPKATADDIKESKARLKELGANGANDY